MERTLKAKTPPLSWALSAYATLVGAIWGLALARSLALEMHIAFFSNPTGALLLMIISGGLVFGFSRWCTHHALPPTLIAAEITPLLLPLFDVLKGDFAPWRGPVLLLGSLSLALFTLRFLPRTSVPHTHHIAGTLAIGLPLLMMLPDISPYVGRADTFEFQVVAPRLGIAHPSGYPLYILIGKLFSLLPIGTVAWRVNLSSTIFTAAASGILYYTLTEISAQMQLGVTTPLRKVVACDTTTQVITTNLLCLIVALTMAFSPTLWSRSIEAEVYALNAFIVTLGLWLAVRWATGKLPPWHAVPAFALLAGIALASHLTLGALLLMGAPLLLTTRPRPSLRLLNSALGLFAAGVGLYLYIPARWPAVNHGEIMTLAHFWRFITNAESGGALRPLAFIQDPARWGTVFRLIQAQVGWVGILLAAAGLTYLAAPIFRRRQSDPRWKLALGTTLAFCAWIWFNLSFYVAEPDYAAFLIPAHVVLTFWLGTGALCLLMWLSQHLSPPYQQPATILFVLALAYLPLSQLWHTGPTLDTKTVGYKDEAWGRYVLSLPLANNAVILADSEKFPPLYYLQQIQGLRPDLELVTLFNEAQYRAALQEHLTKGQTVYLARYLPGMGIYRPQSMGPLVAISPNPQTAGERNADEHATSSRQHSFGQSLVLRAHQLEKDPVGRRMHHLTLTWQITRAITQDLEVRLRWVTPEGEVAWQSPGARPVNGYTTTQNWQAGDIITDYHALPWPTWLPPGIYTLELGLFPRFQTEGLPITPYGHIPSTSSQSWLAFARINLETKDNSEHLALPQPINAQWQGTLLGRALWLDSADLPTEGRINTEITLDLAWKAGRSFASPQTRSETQAAIPQQLFIQWIPKDAQTGDKDVVQPETRGVPYPPTDWPSSNRVIQTPSIHLRYEVPPPTKPGHYHVNVGWMDQEGEIVPGRCTWLGPRQPFCPLGRILMHPPQTNFLANFGDKILLTEANLGATHLTPGDSLPLTLQWRGLRTLAHDYTIFVQLIGPDGNLYGQVDTWPSQGTRPTSTWAPGEHIDDPHTVPLAPEAPPGRYRVIVGWYLLATMERLPMVNAQDQVTGDFYTIGEITVP